MENPQKRTIYDWILETVSVLALLWSFYPLLFYGRLDDETLIPIHYNLAGEIDGWGGRYFLWIIPLIALVFYIGLSVFEKYYKSSSYPFRITEKNAEYLYRQRVQLSRHLKVFSIMIFAYLNNLSYAIATGKGSGLSKSIMIFLMAALFISLIFFYVRMGRYKQES